VQADHLDQPADLRLRAADPQLALVRAQPLREARQVDHQRGVREAQLGEVDDDVARRRERGRQRAAAAAAGRPVLVTRDPEDRPLLIEADDPDKLVQTARFVQRSDERR
jgi:hypothetical protein